MGENKKPYLPNNPSGVPSNRISSIRKHEKNARLDFNVYEEKMGESEQRLKTMNRSEIEAVRDQNERGFGSDSEYS
ncbi:hypothetical protein L484_021588 [Morus notabilis]|uniref:Uncharacterized protein n=1 Tax=Morus notabilis TaxID=981085 RepID=W9SM59_9ROSA|nr:hypothetical protein L484_021588 [Morus notabilis]